MKKSIIIVAMIVILSGIVYAQDLRLDGYINTGLGLLSNDQDGDANDARLRAFGIDAEQPGFRFRLNGVYTNEANNAGIRFRLQSQGNYGGSTGITFPGEGELASVPNLFGYFSMPYVFGWVGFLENKITLSGGILEDNAWTTGDWWLASDSMNHFVGLGTLLKVTPINGLVLGAGAHLVGRAGGGDNNRLQLVNFGTEQFLENTRYVFHAGYTMPNMFRVDLSYRTEGGSVAAASSAEKAGNIGADNSSRLYADVRLLAVDNLTAVVAASFNNLGESTIRWNTVEDKGFTFQDIGETIISQTFAYRIDDLRFGLNAAQWMRNGTTTAPNSDQDASLLFNPWVSYTINTIVPRLDLAYFAGGSSSQGNWHRRAFTAAYNSDVSLFSIRPSVRINLDGRTHFEIGNMLNIDSPAEGDNRISNVFYVDLRWSF